MYEVRISGTFITGATVAEEHLAKQYVLELLKSKLEQASLWNSDDLFSFEINKVEAIKL